MFNSAAVAVTPSRILSSAPVDVIAVPPTFHDPSARFGCIGVVPSSRSSIESKFAFNLFPHVSSDAPISGLVNEYVVVVVSAISNYPNG